MRTWLFGSTFLLILIAACAGGSGTIDDAGAGTSSSSSGSSGATSGGTSGGTSGTTPTLAECSKPDAPKVTFEARPSTGVYCMGAPGTCSAAWLSILRAGDKTAIGISRDCGADCGTCETLGCTDVCNYPQLAGPGAPIKAVWSGVLFEPGTCSKGPGASRSCSTSKCAPPGRYLARMCGYRAATDAGQACQDSSGSQPMPTCTDVEFDWPPSTGTVTGSF